MTAAASMVIVCCILLLSLFVNRVDSFTHWVVTEDGRIQHQLESTFAMTQPDNLAAFLNQEKTQENLKEMHKNLILRHEEIEANEDKETDLESRHYELDADCIRAGKRFSEFDLFIHSFLPLTDKGIKIEDHITLDESLPLKQPNCSKFFNLPFSVHAYDHLAAVQHRDSLERQPLKRLKNKMDFLKTPKAAATAIHDALEKNSTSWVLYNLASFYWRLEGNTSAAVECIRRALHFSPENVKDVALVNLANVLHQADYTKNATVVLLHALDVSGGNDFVNYYHLGNMFASMGNFNRSIYYYKKSLRFKADFQPGITRLAAVKCELKLQEKLEAQHDSLQRTLHELQQHRLMHEKYQEKLQHLTSKHHSLKEQLEAHLMFEQQKLREGSYGNACEMKTKEGRPYLVCEISSRDNNEDNNMILTPEHHQLDCDEKYGKRVVPASPAEKVFKKIREIRKSHDELLVQYREYQKKLQQMKSKAADDDISESADEDGDGDDVTDDVLRPKPKVYHSYYDYTHPDWPPKKNCEEHVKRYPQWDEFPSGYIDPQSRNFPVRSLLTSYIGIANGKQHTSPWRKPDCSKLEENPVTAYDIVSGISADINSTMWKQDTYLNNYLLRHVNEGTVWPDDIGQRILSALKKAQLKQDYDHIWVLYNLAGLFWRVNGDNTKAVECLRRSVHHAPKHHKDIPLVGLANIMYRNGRTSDALNLLIYALKVNNSEPVTYLSMGNVLQENMNLTGAVQFYNYALVLHPDYKEALQSLLIVKCFKITGKRSDGQKPDQQQELDNIRKEVETEKAEKTRTCDDVTTESSTCGGDVTSSVKIDHANDVTSNDVICERGCGTTSSSTTHHHSHLLNNHNYSRKDSISPTTTTSKHPQQVVSSQGTSLDEVSVTGNSLDEEGDSNNADVLIQKAEELISKLVNENDFEEQVLEKLTSAQKIMKSLNFLQSTISNLVDDTSITLSTSKLNDHCANISKIDFTDLEHQNLTEAFLYEMNFSLDVAIDDHIEVDQPVCNVDKNMMNFMFDFQNVKTNYSKPEPRLDTVAKEFIDETESPTSLGNYLASAALSHPHNWRVALLSALYWRTVGNVRQTFACFQLAMSHVHMCCRDVIIYVVIDYMTHLGRISDAVSLCEKLQQRHPLSSAVHYLMGNLYASQGRLVRALSAYKNVLKYNNSDNNNNNNQQQQQQQEQTQEYRNLLLRIQNIQCLLMNQQDHEDETN